MILDSFGTDGIKSTYFWIIAALLSHCLLFSRCPSVSSLSTERRQVRRSSSVNPTRTKDTESGSVEFQPGDFAGDYQLSLEEAAEQTKRKFRVNDVLKRKLRKQDGKLDFDQYDDDGARRREVDPVYEEEKPAKVSSDIVAVDQDDVDYESGGGEPSWESPVSGGAADQQQRIQEFDEPPEALEPPGAEQQEGIVNEVHRLEKEIKKLELERGGATTEDPNATVKANLTYLMKYKQYRNLTDGKGCYESSPQSLSV